MSHKLVFNYALCLVLMGGAAMAACSDEAPSKPGPSTDKKPSPPGKLDAAVPPARDASAQVPPSTKDVSAPPKQAPDAPSVADVAAPAPAADAGAPSAADASAPKAADVTPTPPSPPVFADAGAAAPAADTGAVASAADAAPPLAADAGALAIAADVSPEVVLAKPLDCGDGSPTALASCVKEARYVEDLSKIVGPRPPGTAHWKAVQDLCAQRFASLGFTVERHNYGTGVNVIGVRKGTTKTQSVVLVGAHYDSVPDCPGADDNATGVAGLFETARVLASTPSPKTLLVACWDEEERNLKGSGAWLTRARTQGQRPDIVFNFEMIGFINTADNSQRFPPGFEVVFPQVAATLKGRNMKGDFLALIAGDNAKTHVDALVRHAQTLELSVQPVILTAAMRLNPALSDFRRSDHAPFWGSNIPAIMVTDTADFRNGAYHCKGGPDDISTLNHGFATKTIGATVGAISESLQ